MPRAITSAGLPGLIFDTLPKRTLLVYFVPSFSTTTPSLPASADFSVRTTLPSGLNVMTSLVLMLTTTMLPCGSIATPFGIASGAPSTNVLTVPSAVTLKMRFFRVRACSRRKSCRPCATPMPLSSVAPCTWITLLRRSALEVERADRVAVDRVERVALDRAAERMVQREAVARGADPLGGVHTAVRD